MRKIITILALLIISGASLAGDIVLGNGNATLTYTPAGGANMVITWPPPYTPPSDWTPTWAIRMNVTNSNQYTDSGLYVQKNWQVIFLANIRSNAAGYHYMGTALAGSQFYIGHHTSGYWTANYGNATIYGTPVFPTSGWMFVNWAPTNFNYVISTNGAYCANSINGTTFTTNTTQTFYVGQYDGGTAGRGPTWDMARIQFIDPNGVLRRDLIATQYGYFTNKLDGAIYTFGVNGVGGSSGDSTNITGQTFPSQTWK